MSEITVESAFNTLSQFTANKHAHEALEYLRAQLLGEQAAHNADMAWPSDDGERFATSIADLIEQMHAEDDVEDGDIVTVNIGKSLGSVDVHVKVDAAENVTYEIVPTVALDGGGA